MNGIVFGGGTAARKGAAASTTGSVVDNNSAGLAAEADSLARITEVYDAEVEYAAYRAADLADRTTAAMNTFAQYEREATKHFARSVAATDTAVRVSENKAGIEAGLNARYSKGKAIDHAVEAATAANSALSYANRARTNAKRADENAID